MMQLLAETRAQVDWEDNFWDYDRQQGDDSDVTKSQLPVWQRETNTTTGMVPAPRLVLLDEIWSPDRVLKLREAVQVPLYWADELWTCELESLRIMGYGESQEQALEAFFEDFFAAYDGLVPEDDSSLTVDARLAKRVLQNLVVACVPAYDIARELVGRI